MKEKTNKPVNSALVDNISFEQATIRLLVVALILFGGDPDLADSLMNLIDAFAELICDFQY